MTRTRYQPADRRDPRLPSEIATAPTPPVLEQPKADLKPGQIFTDWAAI